MAQKFELVPIEKEEKEQWELTPVKKEEKITALGEFGKLMGKGVERLGEFGGAAITGALTFGGRIAAQPAYGLYQQWKEGFKDVEKPWEIITKTIEKGKPAKEFLYERGPYAPKSEHVQKVMSEMFYPFALYDKAKHWVVTNISDDPTVQESIDWAGDVALAFGLAATTSLIKSSFNAKQPPKIATLKRTILQSKKVPRTVKDKIKMIPEEPEIIHRMAKQVAQEIKAGTTKEKGIMEVEQLFKETEKAFAEIRKLSVKRAYQKLKRATVDTSGNLKKALLKEFGDLGKEAVIHLDLARGSNKAAEVIIHRAVTEVYGGLKAGEIKLLDDYIQSTRIQKVLEYKPKHRVPRGKGRTKHEWFTETLPEKIKERGEAYFDIMQKMLDDLLDAGVINEASHVALSAHAPYSPFKFIQHLDPARQYSFKGGISVPSSGIKRFDMGSYQFMEKNSRLLIADVANRTYGRIFRNEANKAAYTLAEQVPDNGIFKAARITKTTKEGKTVFEKTPTGHEIIDVMIDGRPRRMFMPRQWAQEWVLSDPMINQAAAQIAGWLSGSKILKPMATGLNPEFAITNFPRDLAHIWIVTNQYSSFLPKSIGQMGIDLIATARDAFGRRGTYLDYINEGGGMQFLTHQGRVFSKVRGVLGKVQDYLAYAGETSELWSRLALRRRAIKNGLSPYEATWEARNYLDFNQGGSLAKGVDSAVPYLNASIQGTRGIFRAFAQRPMQSTWKVAQLGTMATGLYLANRFGNPECLASVSVKDKIGNFIITTPWKYVDKNGDERHVFFKIAKDQGQRVFCTIFENIIAKYIGDSIDAEQIMMALEDAVPIMPTQTLPPTLDALMGYALNKDLWTREDIWRGTKRKPSEEWTDYTHPALVGVGKATGLSPERLRYTLQQYFTYGNIYTDITGSGIRLMLGQMPKEYQDKIKQEIIMSMPLIRRTAELTSPYAKHEKMVKKISIEESTRKGVQTRDLDRIAENYYRQYHEKGIHDKALWRQHVDYVESQPKADKSRLYDRFDRFGKLYRIPNRRWWLNLIGLSPEARAQLYWAEHRNAKPERQALMDRMLTELPGIATKRFIKKLAQLELLDK